MLPTRPRLCLAVLLAGVLQGCGDDPPQVSTVQVTPGTVQLDAVLATTRLSATAHDATGAAISGADVTWSSTNPDIAAVDVDGTVTAMANGTATIRASVATSEASAQGTATVTVREERDMRRGCERYEQLPDGRQGRRQAAHRLDGGVDVTPFAPA